MYATIHETAPQSLTNLSKLMRMDYELPNQCWNASTDNGVLDPSGNMP